MYCISKCVISTIIVILCYRIKLVSALRQSSSNLNALIEIEHDQRPIESTVGAQQDYVDDFPPGDYPAYREIPLTGFSCLGKLNWHYYADLEAGCQVFHVCETQFSKVSFLCPIGSVFNQRHLVCDWWYNVDCNNEFSFYGLNNGINIEDDILKVNAIYDEDGKYDLNLASSGENNKDHRDGNKNNKRKGNLNGEGNQVLQNVVQRRKL